MAAKRDRAAYSRERYRADPEKARAALRASYAKHREKRLAYAKETRAADPEAARAYCRAMYAKHQAARVEDARRYRREQAERINAKAREHYHSNREVIAERRKGYRAKHYDKIYAAIQRWRKGNPDRELFYHAKRLINEQTGTAIRDIPAELAEAKVVELLITRWARDGVAWIDPKDRPASVTGTGTAGTQA